MPTWQPNWVDVQFDFAGADAAIAECRMLRHVFEDRDSVLAGPLALAREEWRGPKRALFDTAEAVVKKDVRELIEELRHMEERTAAAIASANNEQVVRVRQRAQWHGELKAEQEVDRRRLAAQVVADEARKTAAA
jgi:hypothetical protein